MKISLYGTHGEKEGISFVLYVHKSTQFLFSVVQRQTEPLTFLNVALISDPQAGPKR